MKRLLRSRYCFCSDSWKVSQSQGKSELILKRLKKLMQMKLTSVITLCDRRSFYFMDMMLLNLTKNCTELIAVIIVFFFTASTNATTHHPYISSMILSVALWNHGCKRQLVDPMNMTWYFCWALYLLTLCVLLSSTPTTAFWALWSA